MPHSNVRLTDQQRAVVAHDHGPALVFAVAGAGKTTAMVHRIERLVRERVYTPQRILATSFGKANEQDLRHALARWPHCAPVHTRTLHALGYIIVRQAQARGLLSRQQPPVTLEQLPHHILSQARAEAFRQDVAYKRELDGLDWHDFLDYIGRNKANLAYANLKAQRLPSAARALAVQAQPPSEKLDWYLELFQLYEQIRRERGWITFDDMLVTAWELLHTDAELLAGVQGQYDCVLVDEFQDINVVQSELLDLLTAPHRNYMVIGDDDQTIYEWRGAQPRFILSFEERYAATRYLISDNFRCPAAPLVLANQVIAQNTQRFPKHLNLTRGFEGDAELIEADSAEKTATWIADRMQVLKRAGRPWRDMAVLVRLNAQTPFIEQELIARQIPYRVSKPFYERIEIETLIEYCRLAWIEQRLASGHVLTGGQRKLFESAWRRIANRPKRYLNASARQTIAQTVLQTNQPLSQVLRQVAEQSAPRYLAERLEFLAKDLAWLSGRLDAPAQATLRELDARLAYRDFLLENSGSPVSGEGRATGVTVFIQYARDRGSLQQFMSHIRDLARQRVGRDASADAVSVTTIHQAKGLEWPVVFVPQINDGIIPFTGAVSQATNVEEERRLFYVAITRSRDSLYLLTLCNEPPSPFLLEAKLRQTLAEVAKLRRALEADYYDPTTALFVAHKTREFKLQRFLKHYWRGNGSLRAVTRLVQAAQRQSLLPALDLQPEDTAFWHAVAPVRGTADEAYDLTPLLHSRRQEEAQRQAAPQLLKRHMWVECDAGWGEIRWIEDGDGRYVPLADPQRGALRLFVALRTESGSLPVVIELPEKTLRYTAAESLHAYPVQQKLERIAFHREHNHSAER